MNDSRATQTAVFVMTQFRHGSKLGDSRFWVVSEASTTRECSHHAPRDDYTPDWQLSNYLDSVSPMSQLDVTSLWVLSS